MAAQLRDATEVMLGFACTARYAGLPAGPGRTAAFLSALTQLDPLVPTDVYWAGRCLFTAEPADAARYDAVFRSYFDGETAATTRRARQPTPPAQAGLLTCVPDGGAASPPQLELPPVRARASATELLRHRDVATLDDTERAAVATLLTQLRLPTPLRRSRRQDWAAHGGVDRRRTVRAALRHDGELLELARRHPRHRPRRVVLLVDVSGSMANYADMLLRLGHLLVRRHPGATEVFTIGTRLTRLTRELDHRDAARAMEAVADAVPDYSGGTRLGEMLGAFLDRWGQRGSARGAVVVLCSDGWERGDATELGRQMSRLRRLAHRVVWVTPHKGREGWRPATAGLTAALPHVHATVAGHSVAALQELLEVIADA